MQTAILTFYSTHWARSQMGLQMQRTTATHLLQHTSSTEWNEPMDAENHSHSLTASKIKTRVRWGHRHSKLQPLTSCITHQARIQIGNRCREPKAPTNCSTHQTQSQMSPQTQTTTGTHKLQYTSSQKWDGSTDAENYSHSLSATDKKAQVRWAHRCRK